MSRYRSRLSPVLALLLMGVGCRMPIEIVRVTPSQLAQEALAEGDRLRDKGLPKEAAEAYARAWRKVPHEVEAWIRWKDVSPQNEWQEALATLEAWHQRQPTDPRVNFLLGLFSLAPSQRWEAFQKSWQGSVGRSGEVDNAWVLRTDAIRPAGVAGWRWYLQGLESLSPRHPALEFALASGYWEIGELQGVRRQRDRLPAGGEQRDLLDILLLLSGDDVPRGDRQLEEYLERTRLPGAARSLALRVSIMRILRKRERVGARHHLDDLRRSRRYWSVTQNDVRVLEALVLALEGERSGAYRLLNSQLPQCFSPRLRIHAILLLQSWHAELAEEGVAIGDAQWALRDAYSWSDDRRDLEQIFNTAIRIGSAKIAGETLDRLIELWPDAPEVDRWREDRLTLAELIEHPQLVSEAWHFFVSSSVQRRRDTLANLPEELRRRVLARAVELPNASIRLLALHSLRDKMLIPFDQLPAALAKDGDPRVRASWIQLAARAGGNIAREAILSGREDPDQYVRQVSRGLKLPDEN